MEKNYTFLKPIALFLGLVIAAFILGDAIQRFKKEDRSVSVKGFSEKEVKANMAIWNIKIKIANDDLIEGNNSLELSKKKVVDFLLAKGINKQEIAYKDIMVLDNDANEYAQQKALNRYIIEETIEVRTNNVDLVQRISRMTGELLSAGVAMSTKTDWTGSGIKYVFTDLNTIKPQMIIDAIGNAKEAALQFAKESNCDLGKVRKASQGFFSIQDRDVSLYGSDGEGGYQPNNGTLDVFKKVRVVVSVDYSIE